MKENCKIDEISERDGNINFEAALFDQARKSQCLDKELVCCHEDNKKIAVETIKEVVIDNTEYDEYGNEVILCSEVAVDGYSCVPTDQCEGLLEVRGAGEPTCEDKSQICCHESKEIKSDITIVDNTEYDEYSSEVILCTEVAVDGYSCVPTDQCEGLLEVRGAGEPTCEDKSQICCHESKQIESDQQFNDSEKSVFSRDTIFCEALEKDGYKCVPNDQCNDLLGKRTQDFDYSEYFNDPKCEDSSKTCCPKSSIKKTNETTERATSITTTIKPEQPKKIGGIFDTKQDDTNLKDINKVPDYYGEEEILCSEVTSDGYSCVPNDQCEDLLEVRGAGEPTCEDSFQKCCHESKKMKPKITPVDNSTIIEPDYYGEEEILCSEVASDGYSCVPSDQCEDLLEVRGAVEPTCEDSSQKCCHESKQLKPKITPIDTVETFDEPDYYGEEEISCSDVASDGYNCVPRDQCEDLLEVRGAGDPTCEDSSQKCCHESKQLKPEKITLDNDTLDEPDYYGEEEISCLEVASDGYSCVPSNQCEDLLEVRGAGEPTCEDLSQKCCHESKQLKPEITSEPDYYGEEQILCSEVASDGYSCVPSEQCEDLLEVRGAGEPTCEDSSQKCCHESKHLKPEITTVDNLTLDESDYYGEEEISCSEVASDGYSCVPSNRCEDLLEVRGAGEPTCEDLSQKCCHESKQLKPEITLVNETENISDYYGEEVILCSEVASDGYKCVPNDQCEDLLGKRTQAFDYYDAVSSPICEDSSKTCCPISNIKKPNL